ncbi:FAD-dependent oxidoreductase [Thiomicrospira microaerophila]|uniref:FAD-dependent oxidoreductase n=1 Tax=Thiomicrospira microaerophila TaxID=406020 RepID=UPI0005C9A6C4|nr:FAD-dependent oxidoreductase [Thiomicrospira microaerophila]
MSQMGEVDVAVVGGGMVGAATALGLAQAGFKVAMIERQPPSTLWFCACDYSPRVSALTRASEMILRNLGAWQGVEMRRIHPFQSMRIWEESGDAELVFDAASVKQPNLGYVVENNVVQSALWEQLEHHAVQLICGYELASIQFDSASNQACLALTDFGQLSAQLVIGADGAFSQVRQMAGIGLDQHDYAQCAVVGCVRTQASHQDTCWQRYRAEGPFAFLAMPDNISSIAWYLPVEKMAWALGLSDEDYREQIYQASDGRLGAVVETWERAAFPLTRRHAQHYVKPGLVLVGDAAHTIHPQAGQGVNLGLLDAAVLIDVLTQAKAQNEAYASYPVLRRYERWRRGDNALVQRSMEGFDWLFKSDKGVKDAMRNPFLSLANLAGPIKNLLIKQALFGREPLPNSAKTLHYLP